MKQEEGEEEEKREKRMEEKRKREREREICRYIAYETVASFLLLSFYSFVNPPHRSAVLFMLARTHARTHKKHRPFRCRRLCLLLTFCFSSIRQLRALCPLPWS